MIEKLALRKDADGEVFLRVTTEDEEFDLYPSCVAVITDENGCITEAVTAGWIMEQYNGKLIEGEDMVDLFQETEARQRAERLAAAERA